MIICIADSHCSMLSGKDVVVPLYPEDHEDLSIFKTCRIGPSTAYNFHKKHDLIMNVLNHLNPTKEHKVMLMCGEIDCRYHIGKIADQQNKSLFSSIINTVDNYFIEVDRLLCLGYKIIICSVSGSTWFDHSDDPVFPRYKDELYRNALSKSFNTLLEASCKIYEIQYLDLFKYLIDENLRTRREFYLDDLHLRSTMVLPYALKELKND